MIPDENEYFGVVESDEFADFIYFVDKAITEGWVLHGPVERYEHALVPDSEPAAYASQSRTGWRQYIVRYPSSYMTTNNFTTITRNE